MALAKIIAGKQDTLYLGNLDSKRDWGYAPEYVEGMWLAVQHDEPVDIVLGTGESHSIRDFLDAAFGYADLDWSDYVKIDQRYVRPLDVNHLQADSSKARELLGWEPKVKFSDLVKIMVDSDMELNGLETLGQGKQIIADRFDGWHNWVPESGANI